MTLLTDRRSFLLTASATGLVVGLLPKGAWATAKGPHPDLWVVIGRDNRVTIRVNRPDMGQGTMTAMPMLVAEELDVPWENVRAEFAPVGPEYDRAPLSYGVGGSSAVRETFVPLRRIGAGLRLALVQAAARRWNVAPLTCRTDAGHVLHPAHVPGLAYSDLLDEVRPEDIPAEPALKDRSQFTLLGTRVPETTTPSKVDGSAVYGIDVTVPGMLIGMVVRGPTGTATLRSADTTRAAAVRGVRWIGEIETGPGGVKGVGIVAEGFWPARKARDLVTAEWDLGGAERWDSDGIRDRLVGALDEPATLEPIPAPGLGEAIAASPRRLERVYSVPFQAHAAMEPMSCTAHVRPDGVDLWVPVQSPTYARTVAARILQVPAETVTVHPQLMGGSFGRKYTSDYIRDALMLSRAAGAPVKLIWTREDDMAQGQFRPAIVARLSAALDGRGRPTAWDTRLAGPSFQLRSAEDVARKREKEHSFDPSTVEGLCPPQYPVPCVRVAQHWVDVGVRVMWWRAVGHSFTAFFAESFVDELAHEAGADPIEFRLELLAGGGGLAPAGLPAGLERPAIDTGRMSRVLRRLRQDCDWEAARRSGRHLGVAAHFSFGTYVGQVAEVEVTREGIKVPRVWSTVDCGQTVHPGIIEQQVQGSVVFGLTACLKSAVTIRRGRVEQTNFDTFPLLRMDECPEMPVTIMPSDAPPGGIGEPALPPVAPAVANALFAATGVRVRDLPLRPGGSGTMRI